MKMVKINLAQIFSKFPGPRYISEGDNSGELFRTKFLLPEILKSIKDDYLIELNLDGTKGYGTSFIEEIFGGLIRENNIKYEDIKKRLKIISTEEDYLLEDIDQYLSEANENLKHERA